MISRSEWKAGYVDGPNEDGNYTAAIDVGPHGAAIECHGDSMDVVVHLRNQAMGIAYEDKRAPVQGFHGGIPWVLHMEAYAAYSKKWAPQKAMIEGGCRGGFSIGELDKFIPGWRERISEWTKMRNHIKALEEEVLQLRASKNEHKINSARTVAVSTEVSFNNDMASCPRGVKVQLLGRGGCALYGNYDGKDPFYIGWAPVPSRRSTDCN